MLVPLATFADREFLVEAEWLAAHLGEPDLRVIDCTVHIRFDPALTGPTRSSGREDFERGHIPGAQFVDVVTELSDPTSPVPCMAPSAAQFAAAMSRLGVANASRIVLYSGQNAYWAARVWWLLRLFGFDNAAVLNGGWQKWRREGRPTEAGPAKRRRPSRFVIRAQRELVATKAEVLAAIGDPSVRTINALPADQHLFTSGVHYGRPGHIAGSLNVPAEDLVDPVSNEFLPADRLRQHFEKVGAFGKRVITYCGAGSAASADAMALMMLGHPDVKLYDGSLCEWAVDPSLPMEAAPVPPSSEQVIAAIENSNLVAELHDALAREHAMAEVLKVINSSPGDLAPVFDAMLEKAMRLCEAAFGYLMTYDGERFQAVAHRGLPAGFAEYLPRMDQPGSAGAYERIKAGAPLLHIIDLKEGDVYESSPLRRALVDLGGARAGLIVALRKDEALLGVFTIYRQEVRPFTDKQIALLQNFAAQAVIAMENARLITETREALEQQTATAEVLGVINSSPGDLTPVFDAMLEKALHLCGAAFGILRTYDGKRFHTAATRGVPEIYAEFLRTNPQLAAPGTLGVRIAAGEPVVHVLDRKAEAAYWEGEPHRRASVDLGGGRTTVAVPLTKDRRLVGAIEIYRQHVEAFSDKQIALLQNFAAQAVIAIENARLIGELRQRTEEVAELNRGLEARVAEQVEELGRVGRLKRFLAPQLAELIVSQGDEKILESHRREIVVVFCDLRGYTAFTETAEPEEVLDFLREYHGALGPLVSQFEGTLDQFSGDGIMVFFNDPVPCADPAERAVKMAVAMREAARELIAAWSRHGCELGFGVGIAQGYATLGQIGFSERSGYTAIGTVCNLAARLCAEAKDGQILISSRIAEAVEAVARLEDLGNLELKGLRRPVAAFNIAQSTSPAEARPNLTVVPRDTGV
jgi:3-mercaptopyruvate sulfurtransferase SseA/class 3 adenylate cyclase